MESEFSPPSTTSLQLKCCRCKHCSSTMKKSFSTTCLKSTRYEYDALAEENQFNNARIDLGNECMELRETVNRQQNIIHNLISELEKERNAAASAANETMSMILRLQRDKAEIQLEARQFKMYSEEKLAHDQQEIAELEDMLYKKEEVIQALSCEAQSYKHRMMSYGLTEAEADGEVQLLYPSLVYSDGDYEIPDIEKYAFGETPESGNQSSDLEFRISHLERSPRAIEPDCESIGTKYMLEKMIVGESPRTPMHLRKFSTDSTNSPKEIGPDFAMDSPKLGSSFKKTKFSYIQEASDLRKVGNASEAGDDLIDRVCMIDSVYPAGTINGIMNPTASVGSGNDRYVETPRESLNCGDARDLEMQKLYARLRALEADRELMRQAIISMGTEKAQMVLLKEIAQNWCREVSPARTMPTRKQSLCGKFSFMSFLKWIISSIFWRRKPHKCRYLFNLLENNAGLLLLLDRYPHVGQFRCIYGTSV